MAGLGGFTVELNLPDELRNPLPISQIITIFILYSCNGISHSNKKAIYYSIMTEVSNAVFEDVSNAGGVSLCCLNLLKFTVLLSNLARRFIKSSLLGFHWNFSFEITLGKTGNLWSSETVA